MLDEFYTYDNLNQLLTFRRMAGHTQSFGLDGNGNWTAYDTDGFTDPVSTGQPILDLF